MPPDGRQGGGTKQGQGGWLITRLLQLHVAVVALPEVWATRKKKEGQNCDNLICCSWYAPNYFKVNSSWWISSITKNRFFKSVHHKLSIQRKASMHDGGCERRGRCRSSSIDRPKRRAIINQEGWPGLRKHMQEIQTLWKLNKISAIQAPSEHFFVLFLRKIRP